MKLGVLTVLFGNKPLEKVLPYLKSQGVETVELGCGGYPGTAHVDARDFLEHPHKIDNLKTLIKENCMEISALSCHGNPVHPQREIAYSFHSDFECALLLAEQLSVDTVITFSGCPGDHPGARYPNWVTCPWPDDYLEILRYQWEEVLIPYWKSVQKFANSHGVQKIALEMHPGFCVYNPETLLKLRHRVGNTIGANFDPSHLFWQGINPVAAIRALKDCLFHFHAKDCWVDAANTGLNGILDTKHYGEELHRSWIFRTVGYGHGHPVWKDIFSALRMVEYNGAISIEHEDSLMSVEEGLKKAIAFLRNVMITEEAGNIWWA